MTTRMKTEKELQEQQDYYEEHRAKFLKELTADEVVKFEKIEAGMRLNLTANFYPVPDMRNATTLAQAEWNMLNFRPYTPVGTGEGDTRTSIDFLEEVGRLDTDYIILTAMSVEHWNEEDADIENCEHCGQEISNEYEINCAMVFEDYFEIANDLEKIELTAVIK